MNNYDFQQQVRALKQRVSEMSMRYSPTMPTEDLFSDQLRELKNQVTYMQERLVRPEGPISTMPAASSANMFRLHSEDEFKSSNQFTLPSGPLFWQLFNNLRTDLRSLDGRVATLDSSVSNLEEKVDELDPNRFTPPSSTSGSDLSHAGCTGFNALTCDSHEKQHRISELSSGSTFPIAASSIRPPQGEGQSGLHYRYSQNEPFYHEQGLLGQQEPSGWQRYALHNTSPRSVSFDELPECNRLPQSNPSLGETIHKSKRQLVETPWLVDPTFIAQDDAHNDSPPNVRAHKQETTPKNRPFLQDFKNLEDVLKCARDQNAPAPRGAAHKATLDLTYTRKDILQDSCKLLAYLIDKNLAQAIQNGDKDAHHRELLKVIEKSGLPKSTNVVDNHIKQAQAHKCQPEGLAFRDREIARLDEQLRTSQERLKFSDEGLSASQNALSEAQRQCEELGWSNHSLTVRIRELEDDAARCRNGLEAKDDLLDSLRLQIAKDNETLEDSAREMDETVREHREEMRSLQNFCEQKDGVIYRQEHIISRGRKLLEEREREIESLQGDFRVVRDDKEHAARTADRLARLLEERNAELADLKRRFQANGRDRDGSSVYRRDDYQHERKADAIDGAKSSGTPSDEDARAMHRSLAARHQAFVRSPGSPVQHRSSADNPRPRRSRSSERESHTNDKHSKRQIEFRDERSARPGHSARSGETIYPESLKGGTEQPTQGPPYDATFQPPLPAPGKIRRAESEANLRNASRDGNATPARKSLSKYKSMHEMRGSLQPYVESDVESGGELGGAV